LVRKLAALFLQIVSISDDRSARTGSSVHVVIHYDTASSYLLPGPRITQRHWTAWGNNLIYAANKENARVHLLQGDPSIDRVFAFVNPSMDEEATTKLLKELKTAVNRHQLHHVLLVTSKPSSAEDRARINGILGLVAYYTVHY
ncbi:hypothetical protein PMAYCL1PPCAC_19057, partial [Pristionchus mayeri]